jgi:hypothetical protein
VVLAACGAPEDVAFSAREGTGAGLGGCQCQYYDGTDDDWNLSVTCVAGNGTFDSMSVFIDPRAPGTELPGSLILIPHGIPNSYRGGIAEKYAVLGEPKTVSKKVIRSITGLEVRWDEQDTCEAARGCLFEKFHLLAGGLRAGAGGCEDYYATQRLILSTP